MRLERHLIGFGGIVLMCGVLLAAPPAMAYGQQWRPAQGGDPALRAVQRLANMPGFRPHGAARPSIAPPAERRRYAYRYPDIRPAWGSPPAQAAWQRHPQPGYDMPRVAGHQGMRYPMMGRYPQAAWMNPYAGTMPWGQPMPMFARQFAWRPSGQQWVVQRPTNPRPRFSQPRYSARMIPQATGFRPTAPAFAPVRGAWRPVPRQARANVPGLVYRGHTTPGPARFAGNYPRFRTAPGHGYRVPNGWVAAPGPTSVAMAPSRWRPERVVAGVQRRNASPFRPQAYGRKPAPRTAELAARGREGLQTNRSGLPGWATTYHDSGFEEHCNWCGGT